MSIQETARSFYLHHALQTVRDAELEKIKFMNALTSVGYAKVLDALKSEKQESIVRDIIGRSVAANNSMNDYNNYVARLVNIAVVRWKSNCLQFNTGGLVTQLSVLQQWEAESLQDTAFIVMHSLELLDKDPKMFLSRKYIDTPFEIMFPVIHAWQEGRNRSHTS
jgi:hypothetical protein